MDINKCKQICHKKYKFKIRKIVDKQIDDFFEIENSEYKLPTHKYKIGDEVLLNPYNLLHGIGKNEKALEFVAKNGILSKEATGDLGHHAFEFVAGFWKVNSKISLKDYIKNYSGIDICFENQNMLIPYGEIDRFVENMRNVPHWKWEAISSMEIRFMPSLARDINQYGFILNVSSPQAQQLLSQDINSTSYNKKISKYFSKTFKNCKNVNSIQYSFLNRVSYIIFGLNKCFIEGILVGRNVEKNKKQLSYLKQIFPNCYICNLDGKVILP